MVECIFCEIVKRKISARIVYEDEKHLAFLDIAPKSKGMCIVIPKKHFINFDEKPNLANKTFKVALVVAEKIKYALNPLTIFFSVIQVQVPHFHIRIYPVYEDQIPLIENKPIETNERELDDIANKIRNTVVVDKRKKRKVTEKKPKEIKKEERSEEDEFWLKRSMEVA